MACIFFFETPHLKVDPDRLKALGGSSLIKCLSRIIQELPRALLHYYFLTLPLQISDLIYVRLPTVAKYRRASVPHRSYSQSSIFILVRPTLSTLL